MRYCVFCGKAMEDGAFCPHCGKDQPNDGQTEEKKHKGLAVMSYFACLGIPFFLYPLCFKRKDRYVQFHARQGAWFYCIFVSLYILLQYLMKRFPLTISIPPVTVTVPGVGYKVVTHRYSPIGVALECIVLLIVLLKVVLEIVGISNVARGLERPLPIVGKLFSKKESRSE